MTTVLEAPTTEELVLMYWDEPIERFTDRAELEGRIAYEGLTPEDAILMIDQAVTVIGYWVASVEVEPDTEGE
jgi:hypothetical protein